MSMTQFLKLKKLCKKLWVKIFSMITGISTREVLTMIKPIIGRIDYENKNKFIELKTKIKCL